jgi:hypothetical protein
LLWAHVIGIQIFWLLLGLPGLACLQRFDPTSLERGALSAIGRSYLLSLLLLTPVSVLGYIVRAPLWVLSTACVVAIALSAPVLWRDRRWLRLFARPGVAATACGIWVAFDLWLGVRVGSHVQGDAGYHVARIRSLIALGFNNWDPLLGAEHFEAVYHTNLYHALIAASAQLARVDPGAAWIWVWPFLKLMAAAASYELAYALLGSRASGYLAALTTGVCFATASSQAFPNAFAAGALSAFGLAFALQAASEPPRFAHAVWLAAASLILAQTHPLYALFLGLAVAPLLGLRLLHALLRRRDGRLALLAGLCALGLALPWFLVPARPRLETLWANVTRVLGSRALAQAQAPQPTAAAKRADERAFEQFVRVEPRRWRMDAEPFTRPDNPDVHGIAALLLVAALGRGRVRLRALALLAFLASVAAYLFVPALCTALIKLTAHWVVLRFTGIFFVVCMALVPAAAFGVLAAWLPLARARWLQPALELAFVIAAFAYAERYGQYTAPWTREATWQAALAGSARANAERIAERARFFAQHVEPGAVVMAPQLRDYDIPMHCACRALVFRRGRGERAQTGLDERRAAVDQFYAHDTSDQTRLELLHRYGVRYVYASPRRAAALARGFGAQVRDRAQAGDDAILELQP